MNTQQLNEDVKIKRIQLSASQKFWYYSPSIFFLIPCVLSFWKLTKFYVLDTYQGVRTPQEIASGVYFIIPALLVFLLLRKQLSFKEYQIKYSKIDFEKALKETANTLDWVIDSEEGKVVIAHRNWNWSNSWGELITIVKDTDKIYINSINNPDAIFVSLFSYGWNKKNVRTFIDNIRQN